MPDTDERFDRQPRATAIDQVNEKLFGVRESVSVMRAEFKALAEQVNKGFAEVNTTIRDFNIKYVSREEHEILKGEVRDIRGNLSKGMWIVMGAVFTALVYGLFKSGLVHT